MRGRSSVARLGAPLLLACACNAGALERPDAGGGMGSIATRSDGGTTYMPGATSGSGAVGAGSASAPTGSAVTSCAGSDGSGLPPAGQPSPNVVPTRMPFSCAALPETFIFPPTTLNPPRAYARCASFSVGAATSLSVSPDGRLAVLATADGIARVVELATRQVVAVLAPPRSMIDGVAFSPDGQSILTLASAQREATLWRTGDWTGVTRVWTAELSGHRYSLKYGGGVAFAPDGQSAVVSPGSGVFVLDVASGKVRASAEDGTTILDVAYGLDGTRIVAAVATLSTCNHWPNGGWVELFDSDLQAITKLADLPLFPEFVRGVSAFRVSPTEDLVLVASEGSQSLGSRPFRLSDGAALSEPAFGALPVAFMPDGASVLVSSSGGLQRVRFPDGLTISAASLVDVGPLAISGDGKLVLLGGKGSNLLRTWAPDPSARLTIVCSAEDSGTGTQVSSLSADGQLLAAGVGSDLRVFRRADGARLMSLPMGTGLTGARIQMSPRGGYVAIAPIWSSASSVYAVPNGARVATFPADGSGWLDFLFTSGDEKLYVAAARSEGFKIDTFPFATPALATSRPAPRETTLLGLSGGCPVLYSTSVGAWRSCGTCEDAPVAADTSPDFYLPGPYNAALSGDGTFVALAGPYDSPGVTLWRLRPDPAPLVTIPRRADEAGWDPQEYPVAITPGAARILTGARFSGACAAPPGYEVRVRDTTPGTPLVDSLPPGPTSVDAAVRTVAYGAQLWCAQ